MEKETAVDAQVVETPVVVSSLDTIKAQREEHATKLKQVRENMTKYQQAFEEQKALGIRLEGAIESLDILSKSLTK